MATSMLDIVALGELLIDFTPSGTNEQGVMLFGRNPGGAPANVLAMAAKLGCQGSFIGKVGQDDFGKYLGDVLDGCGINREGLVMSPTEKTTLAFVQFDSHGDRSFTFYRRQGADVTLSESDVRKGLIDRCTIFHFGSVSMTDEPSRGATLYAAAYARERGKLVSFDPNYRQPLWPDAYSAKDVILSAIPLADILKVSEEELLLLTGDTDIGRGASFLAGLGPSVVLVTLGPKGSYFHTSKASGGLPAYGVTTVDTTGAGDAFLGAVLSRLRGKTAYDLHDISGAAWNDIIDFANAAGSLATAKKGAIPALPALDEIETCRRNVPRMAFFIDRREKCL